MKSNNSSFSQWLWDFCCSLKLTLALLILLAATSIIGTVIPQNQPMEEYIRVYGESTANIFASLQFFNMYHSWWFVALLTLFAINLTACSVKRLPRVWKTVRNPVTAPEESHYRALSNMTEMVSGETPQALRDKITGVLREKFAAPRVTEKDGKIHLFAEKMAWARFSVYVTHASILIIFLGAIIGNLFGYKAFVNIVEGTETSRVWKRGGAQPTPIDLDFTLRVDKFSVEFYEGTRRPKLYESIVTVIDNGVEVKKDRSVIVNDPLKYKGIVFYQSSYGQAGDPTFGLQVTDRASGETRSFENLALGRFSDLPGGGRFRVINHAPDFQNFGPAVQIETLTPDNERKAFVVLQNFPRFDEQRGGDHIFTLSEINERYFTGLQVAKDPGVWVVWIGCILLLLGCTAAFMLSHRRLWVTIVPLDNNKTGLMIAGAAHRNQAAFEMAFDELKKDLKQALES